MNYCDGSFYVTYNSNTDSFVFFRCCSTRHDNKPISVKVEDYFNQKNKYEFLNDIYKRTRSDFDNCWYIQERKATCKDFIPENLIDIQVSISRACNLDCPMCYAKFGVSHKDDEYRRNLYFRFLESLRGMRLQTINLTDFGEGFFYKKILYYIATLTNKDCCNIGIITNGVLLTPETLNFIVNLSKVNINLMFSMDSLNKERYEKIRKNANFEKVFENFNYFLNLKNDRLRKIVFMTYDKENEYEIKEMEKFINDRAIFRYWAVRDENLNSDVDVYKF